MWKRTHISLTFSADLDRVQGFLHQPEDWVTIIRKSLEQESSYNTKVSIHCIDTVEGNFISGKGWTPSREPVTVYTFEEMEAALCVWECLNEWTLDSEKSEARENWIDLRGAIGSFELRHQSAVLGKWCLEIWHILNKGNDCFFDGISFDWDVIPMMLEYACDEHGFPTIYRHNLPSPERVALLVARQHLFNEFKRSCVTEARWQWAYSDLVSDHPEKVEKAFESGEDPAEFIQWLGEKYDLTPNMPLRLTR